MFKRLKAELDCIMERDPAAQGYFEILTTYPGLHALLLHRVSHRLWRFGLKGPARVLSAISRLITGIEIHPGAQIGERFFIDHGMGVVIGETAVIGDNCTLYHGVTLGGTSWKKGKRHPTLGNGVVVGAGAKLLGPIEIGDDARVGSNSVVLKNVPDGATVVGIPAHIVNADRNAKAVREEIASKFNFAAYGMTADMPDPVAHAVNHLFDHIQKLDQQIESMKACLLEHGIALPDPPLPELERCRLNPGEYEGVD